MSNKKIIVGVLIAFVLGAAGYYAYQTLSEQEAPIAPPPPEPPTPKVMTLEVYFGNTKLNPNMEDCSKVFPVERVVPKTQAVATAALNELFQGPTEEEKEKNYTSFFSSETKDALKSVHVEEGTAYLNLNDIRSLVPGANSSCGSAQFRGQIEETLKQFPTVDKVIYAINGSPRTFYEWMQVGCTEENNFCDPTPFVGQGVIEGSLGYPSEGIPEDVKVCAEIPGFVMTGPKQYCTEEKIEADKYVYGVGYKLEVPAGEYYVSASRPQLGSYKGYYTEYVQCGMEQACLSHKPIKVEVEKAETTQGVDVLDWRYYPEEVEVERKEEISLDTPSPFEMVNPPILVEGEAKGTWFFEASFPVKLKDRAGNILVSDYAQTEEDWMTEGLVPFSAEVGEEFSVEQGGIFLFYLVLEKDNPSGLQENADQLSIPIYIK